MILPSLAALLGILISPAAAAAPSVQSALVGGPEMRGPARRAAGGAVAHASVTANIVRDAARVGPDHGPPAPHMVARAMSVSAADGRAVPALVYDFE